ncbi:MAG: 50S ribosomal protein L30e [Candidatus Thorarchaeota archaeon]
MSYDLNREIQIIARTGKRDYGINKTLKAAKIGRSKLIILSNNCVKELKTQIEYYSSLADIPIIEFPGTGYDLGALCGRGHIVSAISVYDPGDSKILKSIKKQ